MFSYYPLEGGNANGPLDSIKMSNAFLDLGSGRLIAFTKMEAD